MAEENQTTAIDLLRSKWLGRELVEELTAPTPKELKKPRKIRGGGTIEYVPASHFIRKLNDCFGFLWSVEYPQTVQVGEQIVSKGRLTLHIPIPKKRIVKTYLEEGRQVQEEITEFEILNVTKEQSGSSEVKRWTFTDQMKDKKGNVQRDDKGNILFKHRAGDVVDLGDDFKAAQTDAMKKCATHFGIYLDVYESGTYDDEGGGVKESQWDAFYTRAKEADMTEEQADKWAEERIGKPKAQWVGYDLMLLIAPLLDIAEANKKEKEE